VNTEDYAIVAGIASYPELGEAGTALDLKGSENDVDAVVAWLTDPAGGHLPPQAGPPSDRPVPNIQIVRSSAFKAPTSADDALPTILELEKAIENLDRIAAANKAAGKGQRVGRRLYIYMSGHGFSPARERGCLYAANARERMGHNVHVSGWLAWLQDAGYFREFVLWMDCCMNRMSFLPPRDPPLPPTNVLAPPGPTFIAFAAQRPLKAVEAAIPEDGGIVHGVFTWVLLQGLRGAAADLSGRVTGRSLADWLRNAQAARMDPRDRTDPEVSKEPEIVREDPGLIFARGVPAVNYPVNLSFRRTGDDEARLWTGAPPRIQAKFKTGANPHNLALRPGLYLVDVPNAGLRQGFEVVGPTSIEVVELGPLVAPAADDTGIFHLDVSPGDPGAEIFIIDHRFSLVESNPGSLLTLLPFGLFKIKTRLGRGLKERIILLDRDRPQLDPSEIVQPLATAAPLDQTSATHEYQIAAARDAAAEARWLKREGHHAALTVMARVWSGPNGALRNAKPWKGVTVVDVKGKKVLNLAKDSKPNTERDPFAVCTLGVSPGVYFLRQHLEPAASGTRSLVLEQSLVIPEGWGLEVHLLRRVTPDSGQLSPLPRLSLIMRNLENVDEGGWRDRLLETAHQALADERRVLNPELEELLMRKFQDPMAGILGAHLLLIEAERNPGHSLEMLDVVVPNLRRLVGPNHPDVEAISLRCPNKALRRSEPLTDPPMLQRSWKLIVEGCSAQPALVPKRLWRQVQAQGFLPPFLIWVTDKEVQAAFRRELAQATWGSVLPTSISPPLAPGLALEQTGTFMNAAASTPLVAPAGDLAARQARSASPAALAKLPRAQQPHRVAREIALERARRFQVPVSVLDILAKEYDSQSLE
jgi:uncharacterized caspase-like protein